VRPVLFYGHNAVYAREQAPYLPLPAHNGRGGRVTTCWSLTMRDRLRVLFTGRVWWQQLTYGKPLQPQKCSIDRPTLYEES